jgi:hypothetical protein
MAMFIRKFCHVAFDYQSNFITHKTKGDNSGRKQQGSGESLPKEPTTFRTNK